MIHVQRAVVQRVAGLLVLRRYGTRALQQRISELFNFIKLNDTPCDPSWHSVTLLPTFDSAVAHLESIASPSTPPNDFALSPSHPPPTWLLVKLCSKVDSPADAEKASHLIITYLPYIPPDLLFPTLDRVIKLFIGLPIFHDFWHFNRLLRALTRYTDTPTDGRHVARLREVPLTNMTYELLLRNRFITLELTEELHQRMIRDKIVPNRAHLESLLRIFAHRGKVRDAVDCARAIPRPPDSKTDQIVPPSTVEYLTHLVHENSQRKQFDADAEWLRFTKTGRSHRFLNNQKFTSAAAWGARLFSLSLTRSFSPESLVMFFDWSHAQSFPFRTHTTITYTVVLLGLLRRSAYSLALEVWERYRRHGTSKLRIDAIALGVGVEVMVRAGHPTTASRQTVPISVVNRFMRVLRVTNPSASLQLWEQMSILYGVTPNALSFTIMLDAARHATLRGDSFTGAMQELGFDLRLRLPFSNPDNTMVAPQSGTEPTAVGPESLDRARRRSYEKFERSLSVNEGDMWGGERAWRRAYRTFTSALLAGWPELAEVRAPAHAVRSSGDGPATAPFRDLKSFLIPSQPDDPKPPLVPLLPVHPGDHNPPLLPIHRNGACMSFAPDEPTFHAAVLLLGIARGASQIPQVLAWMRALGIKPRTRMLSYALVFWAEVSIGAPLLERLPSGRKGGGEYVRFVRWMEEWVGVENVPDEAAIGEAVRKIDDMRRSHGVRRNWTM
ncbi:hypothetical protein BGY98DRAFT_956647, partial [Russula aff. rugulosa BPL654]